LIAERSLRVVALFMIVAACGAGLAIRIAMMASRGPETPFRGVESLDFSLGQSIGAAKFDGIVADSPAGLRLRLEPCGEPIFAAPMLLTDVTTTEVADRAYRKSPAYLSTDVYRGQIRKEFSHFSRLIARSLLETYNLEGGYFVRFYAPADCRVENTSYIEWAEAILKAGSEPERAYSANPIHRLP
jgi:hypothetical protein